MMSGEEEIPELQMDMNDLSFREDHDDDDPHRSVSPETPAESFFISPELRTNNVSAFALASQLRSKASSSSRSQRSGTSTVATDDFQSAFDNEDDMVLKDQQRRTATNGSTESLFGKDILVLSHSVIPEDEFEDDDDDSLSNENHQQEEQDTDEEHTFQDTMSKKSKSSKKTTTTTPVVDNADQANPASVVYEKAKDVWTWGKGLPVVGFFEGITEAVANKVVSVAAGTSLEEIDGHLKPVVAGIDSSYLNPAIDAIVRTLMSGVGKADATFRPVIEAVVPAVLGPLGLIENDQKKEAAAAVESSTSTPELTTTIGGH